jgi:hypothetical protein
LKNEDTKHNGKMCVKTSGIVSMATSKESMTITKVMEIILLNGSIYKGVKEISSTKVVH